MSAFLFYFFAAVAIVSAALVITVPKPTRALLSLIVTMFSLTVIFTLLGATFVAMVHLIVYAGAVLVLFLFVIMLQGVGAKDVPLSLRFSKTQLTLALTAGLGFFGLILGVSQKVDLPQAVGIEGTARLVGLDMFQNFLLPFELTSILLLLGVFAAVALAKREDAP